MVTHHGHIRQLCCCIRWEAENGVLEGTKGFVMPLVILRNVLLCRVGRDRYGDPQEYIRRSARERRRHDSSQQKHRQKQGSYSRTTMITYFKRYICV